LELVLGTIRNHSSVDAVIVGATSLSELKEISRAWNISSEIKDFELPAVTQKILDPREWPTVRMKP
jgi:aryl-alcohol dehydrogenase-like predicted oxidoreductase